MARRKPRLIGCALAILAALASASAGWTWLGIRPMSARDAFYIRIVGFRGLDRVLTDLERKSAVRNATAAYLYARLRGRASRVTTGTYRILPGDDIDSILAGLRRPVRQMVRLPETNWAARSANLLEKHGVSTAADYLKLVRDPAGLQQDVGFRLPESGSLEGYLYPDTYDLPPLLGARETIVRQLRNFEKRVLSGKAPPPRLHRAIIVASMIELEVAKDAERPIVAGVIENRLAKGMPLQIDATINYALGRWRALTRKDIRETESPYNTYLNRGLPPGPICSPSAVSIRAALSPAKHDLLYYVAMPDGRHLFSSTYDEHLRNVAKRRLALAGARA